MITVRSRSQKHVNGHINFSGRQIPCALGRSGKTVNKREGDGATPIGIWPLLAVYYRADRVTRPTTVLPIRTIKPHHGWCDAPQDRNYNRPVDLPYPASAEHLWRDDHLYDVVIVPDYNITRRVKGFGSAIFVHLATPTFSPTEGCVALREQDLRWILRTLRPGSKIKITGN